MIALRHIGLRRSCEHKTVGYFLNKTICEVALFCILDAMEQYKHLRSLQEEKLELLPMATNYIPV